MSKNHISRILNVLSSASGPMRLKVIVSLAFFAAIISRPFSDIAKQALDPTGLTLLALAIIPWVGPIFESIKVAGVEAKFRDIDRKLQIVEATAQEAKGISADAGQRANLAVSATLSPTTLSPQSDLRMDARADEIEALAQEYESIRRRMAAGSVRTQQMTAIVSRMMKYFRGHPDAPVNQYLSSNKIGERLAAYAYYMVYAESPQIGQIIETVAREDKPFNQYWGLQAIARLISNSESKFDRKSAEVTLRRMKSTLSTGTDRYFMVDQILSSVFRN